MAEQFTEERALWLYKHYCWLEANLPKRRSASISQLILPTKQFFPDLYKSDHASAEIIFRRIRDFMNISDWDCRLVQGHSVQHELNEALGKSGVLGSMNAAGAAGTFSISEKKEVIVTYSATSLKNPVGLVATLSHELCHYLLATVQAEPPASWKQLEPLTDLAAVEEGFGVFLCNSALQFTQWTDYATQGWSVQRHGYLTEEELAFALAIFCIKNKTDTAIAARSLKPNPHEIFCDALDYVAGLEENQPCANTPE